MYLNNTPLLVEQRISWSNKVGGAKTTKTNSPTESPLPLDCWPGPWDLASRISRTWRLPDTCRWWRAARCTWTHTHTETVMYSPFSDMTDEQIHCWHHVSFIFSNKLIIKTFTPPFLAVVATVTVVKPPSPFGPSDSLRQQHLSLFTLL